MGGETDIKFFFMDTVWVVFYTYTFRSMKDSPWQQSFFPSSSSFSSSFQCETDVPGLVSSIGIGRSVGRSYFIKVTSCSTFVFYRSSNTQSSRKKNWPGGGLNGNCDFFSPSLSLFLLSFQCPWSLSAFGFNVNCIE